MSKCSVREVEDILNTEKNRKVTILSIYEQIEYERSKSVQSITYDTERVQGGAGANSNPFLNVTVKIFELEEEIERLSNPNPEFEKMLSVLPKKYFKVLLAYYGNCKTIKEILDDWEMVGGKAPSVSSIKNWKREGIRHISRYYVRK